MRQLFVDTSAWVAVVNGKDKNHPAARKFYKNVFLDYGRLVTTNLVIAETYILLRLDLDVKVALSWWRKISASPRVEVVHVSSATFHQAFALLEKFSDQTFSLADAVSFVVMKQREIKEAFTFDSHFLTAGFIKLPAMPGQS